MGPPHHRLPHAHGDVDEEVGAVLAALRGTGGRITTGRREIVRALVTAENHHVTAEQLAELVQREHADVHRSTVYRTLDALEERGVVRRVDVGGGRAVYHLVDHAHHHLVCDGCGAVVEVPDDAFAGLRRTLARRHGFVIAPEHLALGGRCASCAGV